MAFQEEHSEQTRHNKWRFREKSERWKLSASVEAALEDPVAQEEQWLEEASEQDIAMARGDSSSLIPPRLSLQSRAMPAVRSGNFVEDAVPVHPVVAASTDTEDKLASTTQNPNMLVRFAQRLTSSLAAIGATMTGQHESLPSLPPPSSEEAQQLSRQRDISLLPPVADVQTSVTAMPGVSGERVDRSVVKEMKILSDVKPSQFEGQRQRLGGYSTKIRLETAPVPAMPPSVERGTNVPLRGEVQAKNAIDMVSVDDVWEQKTSSTSTHMPVVDVLQQEASTTSSHRRVTDKGEVEVAARESLAGSGVFESGQRDMVVANSHITSSSVVLVMLTANPGPVVVQYISLQPQVGFTVHLTAPVTEKTPFNYVILLGESF
ncbi:MAG: hypothetical protein JOZ18_04905 [Chloroflexi bacterium]|nr:hypothetical protein [Chloroflexota bacterium]